MIATTVNLWDGEKFIQKQLEEGLQMVAEGKAQRIEDHFTGAGLMPRSAMAGYLTKVMVAEAPVETMPEHYTDNATETAPRKRGRPRKEAPAVGVTEDEDGDELSDEG